MARRAGSRAQAASAGTRFQEEVTLSKRKAIHPRRGGWLLCFRPSELRRLLFLLVTAGGLVLLFEAIDSAGGVDQLLAPGEERVAVRADFHADVAFVRRPRLEGVAAGA